MTDMLERCVQAIYDLRPDTVRTREWTTATKPERVTVVYPEVWDDLTPQRQEELTAEFTGYAGAVIQIIEQEQTDD